MADNKGGRLLKNTLVLSIGQFLPKLFSLFTLPIITAYLTTSETGTYDLANTLVALLIPIFTLQIQQGAFRYLITGKDMQEKQSYVTCSWVFVIVSSLILYPIVVLIMYLAKIDMMSCLLICTMLFAESMFKLVGQIARGIGHNLHYSISVVVYAAFNLAFLCIFVIALKMSFYGVMLSLSASYMLAVVYLVLFSRMFKYIRLRQMSKEKMKELLKYSAPIVPSTISLWVCNLSNRLVITGFLGEGANGIYAVANKIPNLYTFAYNTFNLAWTESSVMAADDENRGAYYSDMFDKLLLFLTGALLLLYSVTPILFKILVRDESYAEAYNQIMILYIGVFLNSFVAFFGGIYTALKRTKQLGYSSIAGAVINFVLCFALIKVWGLYAASVATAVSYAIVLIVRVIDLRKAVKLKYSVAHIVFSIIFVTLFAILGWQASWVTMVTSLVIAVAYNAIYNRKLVIGIFNKLLRMVKKEKKTNEIEHS